MMQISVWVSLSQQIVDISEYWSIYVLGNMGMETDKVNESNIVPNVIMLLRQNPNWLLADA